MKEKIIRFGSYIIVGGLATLVEWGCYYIFDPFLGINTYLAVVLSFVVSTFANWLFGRLITFRKSEKQNVIKELAKIYSASVIGLLMNEAIMALLLNLLFTDADNLQKMFSKCVATAIVFFWNYLIRTRVIYRK